MLQQTSSLRPFIGCRDFAEARNFYRDMGFEEFVIDATMLVFKTENTAFYLQDAYVKDWIDNTMLFLEVKDVQASYDYLLGLDLPVRYPGARLSPIRVEGWGRECFVHDPSGVLWHIGQFH